jgi:hypothetical protein
VIDQESNQEPVKILSQREASGPTSTWTEFLTVSQDETHGTVLEICRYEVLEYWDGEDDDGNPLSLPEFVDGKKVVAVEDEHLVGGDLVCWSAEDRIELRNYSKAKAAVWCHERGFIFGDALKQSFRELYPPEPVVVTDPDVEMIKALAKWFDFSKPITDADLEAVLRDIITECGGLLGAHTPESHAEIGKSVASAVERHNRDFRASDGRCESKGVHKTV